MLPAVSERRLRGFILCYLAAADFASPGVRNCALSVNETSSPGGCGIDTALVLTMSIDRLKYPEASRLLTKSDTPVCVVELPSMTTSPATCFSSVSHTMGGSAL